VQTRRRRSWHHSRAPRVVLDHRPPRVSIVLTTITLLRTSSLNTSPSSTTAGFASAFHESLCAKSVSHQNVTLCVLKRHTLRIDTSTGCAVAAESVKSGVCSSSSSLAIPLLAASRLLCNHTGRSALQKQPLVWAPPPPPPPPHHLRPNKGWRVTEFVKRNCYIL